MMDADTTWKIARTKRATCGGRMRGWTRAWSALAAVLVIVVGIGLTLRPHAALPPQSMPLAPDFSLPVASAGDLHSAQGGTLTLRALRGHPVLLSFFLSTCGPCLDELPLLRQTARTYRAQGLVVVGVATLGDTVATARRLARAAHLTYPVVVDNQAVAWQYGVSDVPTSVFVDAQGRLAGQHIGPLDPQTIRDGLAQVGALHCQQCNALEPLSFDATPTSSATFSADFTFARSK
ncbi:MAG: TlpA family protein disulfide reductase, partial [Chloroflexota bacterium]|nr:TlpA family protein disulfide reductase [Chloroflexota bacterium]